MDAVTKSFDKANILVIGGAGFIGSNLVETLLQSSKTVAITIVDNLLSAERINVPDNIRVDFIEGSITDDKILSRIKDEFDYVFHLATYHGNQSSIVDPLADHENNTLTTLKLYEHIKDFEKIKRVVYSSSGCSVAKKTYGDAVATTEADPIEIKQDSPYSISKIIGEFYSVYYHKQHNLPTVRARFQNVYGPGEILGAGKWRGTPATVWRNVIPTFIYKALKGIPLPVEGKGIASRDFIFGEDICRGLIACAAKGRSGDVYNLASGKETTILELASLINGLTGNNANLEYLPKRPWDSSEKRFGSTFKAKQELGFEAIVGLKDGLVKTIEWTKDNLHIIEATIAKHDDKMRKYLTETGLASI
ncbi:MAG: NAD-dependent epimerase/dehydratase family protein [Chloroflexi bacterium]|nr:NAD-dependent epimerase/dehydratase family protein [Chloroflexota bacterium]